MLKTLITLIVSFITAANVFATEDNQYHFDKEPYVHPLIVEDLTSWASDKGDQVVSINITDSISSNRYIGQINISPTEKKNFQMYHNSGNPFVFTANENVCGNNNSKRSPKFGYDLIGKVNDVYILHTSEVSCGTSVWHKLVFVTQTIEKGLSLSLNSLTFSKQRQLINKLGEIPLGDRYSGYIEVEGNNIFISKGSRNLANFKEDTVIKFEKDL